MWLSEHSYRVGGYVPLPCQWGVSINDLEFLRAGDLSFSPFIYLFNHLFISVWTRECLFYTLGYNPMLFYLFCCSDCSSVGHLELFWLAPVSLWHIPTIVVIFFFFNTFLLLTLQKFPGSSSILSAPALESATSSRSHGSSDWRLVLETKSEHQMCSLLTRVSFLGPLNG